MLRIAAVLSAVLSLSAYAGELKGVKMPDTFDLEGKTLKLNGMGLRTKAIFKVYVLGMYLETPSTDPNAIIAADAPRRAEMHMMRDVGKAKITEAIQEGFEKNSKAQLPALKDRLAKMGAGISDLKEGQVLTFTYLPGKGTTVVSAGGAPVVIEGKDFADALFLNWLGSNPVDEDLKKGILAGKP
jgi:hypothetical protein